MPVLYSLYPGNPDSTPARLAELTIHLVTTQWISKGVLLRFLFYNGYYQTFAASIDDSAYVQTDLLTTSAIPPATILKFNVKSTGCSLQGLNSSTLLTNIGVGIDPTVNGGIIKNNYALLCFAFVPTTAYPTISYAVSYKPLHGQPQFAVGFNILDVACEPDASATAPNFPNEYSLYPDPWIFKYSVVFPKYYSDDAGCSVKCTGIKVAFDTVYPLLALGSWSSLRVLIAQPYVWQHSVAGQLSSTPSIWEDYNPYPTSGITPTTNVGPFVFCAMPGQLAVTYFRPVPKNTATKNTPLPNYQPAEAAFLVTAPLPPNVSIYFTVSEYNSQFQGFGIANLTTGLFQIVEPSFTWVTPVTGVTAGTVVVFRGIGGASHTITVADAAGVVDVGSVVGISPDFLSEPQAVTSLTVLGLWQYSGVGVNVPVLNTAFVTAALTDQYGGELPVLAPGVTLPLYLFTGPAIYSPGRIFDCDCLPGPVQAVMINNADFTQVEVNAVVSSSQLAIFKGMCAYNF